MKKEANSDEGHGENEKVTTNETPVEMRKTVWDEIHESVICELDEAETPAG